MNNLPWEGFCWWGLLALGIKRGDNTFAKREAASGQSSLLSIACKCMLYYQHSNDGEFDQQVVTMRRLRERRSQVLTSNMRGLMPAALP